MKVGDNLECINNFTTIKHVFSKDTKYTIESIEKLYQNLYTITIKESGWKYKTFIGIDKLFKNFKRVEE